MKNHKIHKGSKLIALLTIITFFNACEKRSDWLSAKPIKDVVAPETSADFQALLDNTDTFNKYYATAGLVGTDNIVLNESDYAASQEVVKNLYTWNNDPLQSFGYGTWSVPYKSIAYANLVLEGLSKLKIQDPSLNNIKGQALFYRALNYYNLARLYCKAYTNDAPKDLGLPLRLESDVNVIVQRASLEKTYLQIIRDADEASKLLNATQPYLQRPISAAAYALLSKCYLTMGNYNDAELYATKCLNLKPQLLDYNSSAVNLNSSFRFSSYGKGNPEVLLYAEGGLYAEVAPGGIGGNVSPELYQMYNDNDIRKYAFYEFSSQGVKFKGSYTGLETNFCGLAVNEVYLIRAECLARKGNTESAIADLNSLLVKRYKTGTFVPYVANTPDQALRLVLEERRKELPFVGDSRWEDLKRLNKEHSFQITITHEANGMTYQLNPNDKRYVLPIPTEEIQISGIQQNYR